MGMDAERWERIQALFHEAVELDPPRRRAFLDVRCEGDEALADEVLALLDEDARADSLLDRGVPRAASDVLADTLPPALLAQRFGAWRITRPLGEGGMGVVYLARRDDLGSDAAIKILRDAWLSPARRERLWLSSSRCSPWRRSIPFASRRRATPPSPKPSARGASRPSRSTSARAAIPPWDPRTACTWSPCSTEVSGRLADSMASRPCRPRCWRRWAGSTRSCESSSAPTRFSGRRWRFVGACTESTTLTWPPASSPWWRCVTRRRSMTPPSGS